LDFRTDKPEKSNKNKDKPSARPSKKIRDRPLQRSDDEDEEGGKDVAPRQDVKILYSSF
jgi:hypothetical protein